MAVTISGATTLRGTDIQYSWTPIQLFQSGEQGVWYDPSDFSTMFQDIGSRGGTSLRFNGRLYSLIVRGAQSTTNEIINSERWVNTKTKAY